MNLDEEVELLLGKAADDEALLDLVLDRPEASDEIVGFHLQQAVEKLLKALLVSHCVPFPRTHNLHLLMDLLSDAGWPLPRPLLDLASLRPYATLLRYDVADAEGALDRRAMREMVRALRAHVERELAGTPHSG